MESAPHNTETEAVKTDEPGLGGVSEPIIPSPTEPEMWVSKEEYEKLKDSQPTVTPRKATVNVLSIAVLTLSALFFLFALSVGIINQFAGASIVLVLLTLPLLVLGLVSVVRDAKAVHQDLPPVDRTGRNALLKAALVTMIAVPVISIGFIILIGVMIASSGV